MGGGRCEWPIYQAYICEIVKKKQNFKIIEFKLFKHIKKRRGHDAGRELWREMQEESERGR